MRAYINNKPFDFDQEITILEAARQMGFFIPTLCAFKPLCHTPGTCAVCIVRVKGPTVRNLRSPAARHLWRTEWKWTPFPLRSKKCSELRWL